MNRTITVAAIAVLATPALAEDSSPWGDHVEWTEGPIAREHASVMTFGGTVVVYAGSGYEPQLTPLADAWAYDTATDAWTELEITGDAPTPGGSKRVGQTPGTDHAYLFGGYGEGFACTNELHRAEMRAGSLHFTAIDQTNPPPPRALHGFAYDAAGKRFITTLGVSQTGFLDDTWVGTIADDGSVAWEQAEPDANPGARFGFSYGFDSESRTLVVLSGQTTPTPEAPMAMHDDLWALDCSADDVAWARVEVDALPTGRRNPCFAFDDAADRLLVWCGTADGQTNVPGIVWVHQNNAGAWAITETSDAGHPPQRSSGFGFAEPGSDAITVGFGNSAEGRYTDWVTIIPTLD
ncbi:MAG: kelch repeat-containing protein [Phycisphaerales bacterium]